MSTSAEQVSPAPAPAAATRRPLRSRLGGPEAVAAALVVAFIAITAWWLAEDTRIPNGDAGRHLVTTKVFLEAVLHGDKLLPLRGLILIDNEFYPPVVHLVGALGGAILGYGITTVTLFDNLVFVPLLALGVFGAASVAFDRRAGALAVLFILGAPIVIAQFHVFMLDAPLTALTAVSVWLLLLTDDFRRPGMTALAGVAVALGTMSKVTFPIFIAGMVLVMLVRGGWRQWRNLLIFTAVVVLICQPWTLFHWNQLMERSDRATGGPESPRAQGTLGNYGAYVYGALYTQLLIPLSAFAAVGTVVGIVSWVRERTPRHLPELLGGLVVGFVICASMSWFNERYTMPLLVYPAILGVGWITQLPRPGRIAASAALGAVVLLNTVMVNTGFWELKSFRVPGTTIYAAVVSDRGYVENEPQKDATRDLIARAAGDGIDTIMFQGESLNTGGFNLNGLAAIAYEEDLRVLPTFRVPELGENGLYAFRAPRSQVDGSPCMGLRGDYGLYFARGGEPGAAPLYCPSPA